jgi:GNAT superfamily N-acetyltransferase
MAVTIVDLDDASTTEDLTIRPVSEPEDLIAVHEIEVATFGTPAPIAERFVGRRMLEDERVRMFTAWLDDRPVGEATGYLLDGTVGVFGVGVVQGARRRGIGAALTVRAARAFGDRADLAWLQPSTMARRMYEGLGFRAVSDWEVWAGRER